MKMKDKKKICFLGLIIFLILILLNPPATADIINPYSSEKMIGLTYSIDNIDMFEDYGFLLFGYLSGFQHLKTNTTFDFYKYECAKIYAIFKGNFSKYDFVNNESLWDDFFNNNTDAIKSDLVLYSSYGRVPKNDPIKSAHIILTIVSLDEDSLDIDKTKIIFTYNDGTKEEKQITSQSILPKPSRSALLPYWFESKWFIWLPCLALIGIMSNLFYRKKITKEQ
jgi:hypothetical protein